MHLIENPLKKKEPVMIALVLFCLSIIIGCVTAKIAQGLWEIGIDSINSRYFNIIINMEINYKDLLIHVFGQHMKEFCLAWIMSITILGVPYLGYRIVGTGFQVGYLLSILVIHYQWKGLLLFLAYYFPQCLLYIPIALICLKNCYQFTMEINHSGVSSLHNVVMLKKYGKLIIILIGAIIITAIIETFLGSFMIRKALNLI